MSKTPQIPLLTSNPQQEEIKNDLQQELDISKRKLQSMKEKAVYLRNEEENLNLKLHDLRQLIKRISDDKI